MLYNYDAEANVLQYGYMKVHTYIDMTLMEDNEHYWVTPIAAGAAFIFCRSAISVPNK